MAIHGQDPTEHLEIDAQQPSEVLFDLIQHTAGGLFVYEADSDNHFTFVSRGALDMLGYTEDEFMEAFDGRFPMMVYGPDRARVIQAIDEALYESRPRNLHYRIQRKDGSIIWVQDQGRFIHTDDQTTEALVTIMDITEEQESRIALQEMVNATPAGLITLRKAGDEILVESVNHVTRRFLGITNDDLIGRPVIEYFNMYLHPDDYVIGLTLLDELFGPKMEAECIYRMRNLGGEYRWMNYSGRTFPQADGSLLAYGVHIDRTERQMITERLREQQQVYQAAVDTARVLVWEYLPEEMSVTFADSPYAHECSQRYNLPMKIDQLPGGLLQLLDDESLLELQGMIEAVASGSVQSEALLRSRAMGDVPQLAFRVTSVVIYDSVGEPVKVCGTAQDVTRQWAAADDYRQELLHFNTASEPTLIAKGRVDLTQNKMISYMPLSPNAMLIDHTLPFDKALQELPRAVSQEDERKAVEEFIDRTTLLRSFAEGNTSISIEYRQERESKASAWVNLTARLLQNPESGNLEGFIYAYDRTEQHLESLMMQRMTELGYEYVGVLDTATQGFSYYRKTEGSPEAERVEVNYTKMIAMISAASAPDEETDQVLAKAQLSEVVTQLREHGSYEYTFNLSTGGELRRKLCQYIWLDDNQRNVFLAQSDITQQYEEEQARIRQLDEERRAHRHTSDLLQNILNTTPTAIFWKDANLRYQGANATFLRFVGLDSTEPLLNRTNDELGMPLTYEEQESDERMILERGISTTRTSGIYPSADGSVRNIAISKSPMMEDDQVIGLVGTFEDVTDEVESAHEIRRLNANLQAALAEAEQASLAEQSFLSNMSHDMRTPLNGIVGFTRMALATDDPEERQQFLEKIDYSGQLLLAMVNDVLDMSKIASGQMEFTNRIFDTIEMVDQMLDSIRMMAQEKGVELTAELDLPEKLYFDADYMRIQQLLLNVMSNAVKYTPPGGHVNCLLQLLDPPVNGSNTLATISDDGIGMSEEFQKRMYEPFAEEHRGTESASTQGTGLGLSIVKNIVDLMGGFIEVDSKINEGTTFRIYLPIRLVDPAEAELVLKGKGVAVAPSNADAAGGVGAANRGQQELAQVNLAGKRVMVFEDNDLNAQISQAILSGRDILVHRVHDGREGFDTFVASEVGDFDALLMDMRMPKMGGLEAARAIRALERPDAATIPIIAMTADAFADDVQACLNAGMNAHISKPIDPELLIGELTRLWSEQG